MMHKRLHTEEPSGLCYPKRPCFQILGHGQQSASDHFDEPHISRHTGKDRTQEVSPATAVSVPPSFLHWLPYRVPVSVNSCYFLQQEASKLASMHNTACISLAPSISSSGAALHAERWRSPKKLWGSRRPGGPAGKRPLEVSSDTPGSSPRPAVRHRPSPQLASATLESPAALQLDLKVRSGCMVLHGSDGMVGSRVLPLVGSHA